MPLIVVPVSVWFGSEHLLNVTLLNVAPFGPAMTLRLSLREIYSSHVGLFSTSSILLVSWMESVPKSTVFLCSDVLVSMQEHSEMKEVRKIRATFLRKVSPHVVGFEPAVRLCSTFVFWVLSWCLYVSWALGGVVS